MKRLGFVVSALLLAHTMMAAEVQTSGNNVTIRPDGGQAKLISLEVMNDNIIRVRATSKDALPVKPASLMIVPQAAPAKGSYSVTEDGDNVVVKAKNVKAVVSKATGRVTFFDAEGKELLKESEDGKKFWDFTVPERELGIKTGKGFYDYTGKDIEAVKAKRDKYLFEVFRLEQKFLDDPV